jgi:hypothetical protein
VILKNELTDKILSTFSADVDLVSYSNIGRFLLNGQNQKKEIYQRVNLTFLLDVSESMNSAKKVLIT